MIACCSGTYSARHEVGIAMENSSAASRFGTSLVENVIIPSGTVIGASIASVFVDVFTCAEAAVFKLMLFVVGAADCFAGQAIHTNPAKTATARTDET